MTQALAEIRETREKVLADARKLTELAKSDNRDLTDEENKLIDIGLAEADKLKAELERAEQDETRANRLTEASGWKDTLKPRITKPAAPHLSGGGVGRGHGDGASLGDPQVTADAHASNPKRGFATSREYLSLVIEAGATGQVDPRLRPLAVAPNAAAGGDEQSTFADPYGGYLLPKGFSPDLLVIAAEVDPIAGRTTAIPMKTAVIDIPARTDKDHTNSVSGGLRVYRRAEGDTSSSSRMEIEQVTLRAHSLFGLAYATEELLARSPISFIALLEAGFRDEFGSKVVDERLNGSGVGMMEGIMKTPCLVDITKETGQAATTLVYENVVKMRARCWRYGQAIWLANHDTLPQLMVMVLPIGTAGVNMWQPSAREGEPDLLLGRPIFFTEYCKTLGTSGDLVLGNWSQYLEGTLESPKQAESIHVRFINHERTFKFWLENDGRSWWRAALTPKNSTDTLSPFVTVATRS